MKSVLISFIVVIVIGLIGGVGYSLYTGVNPLRWESVPEFGTLWDQVATDFTSSAEIEKVDAGQIFALFKDVSSVSLDRSLLDDPAFLSLEDISVELHISEDNGRKNPFLPIGIEEPEEVTEEAGGKTIDDMIASEEDGQAVKTDEVTDLEGDSGL